MKSTLEEFLAGKVKLFERDYKITCKCRYKKNGRWTRAKIDLDNKIIYSIDGKVIRRC